MNLKKMLWGTAIGLLPALAFAQTPAPEPTPVPLYSGKGELSFVQTGGNTSTQTLGFAAEGEYRPQPWSLKLNLAFVRAETDEEVKAKSFLANLRGARKIADPIEVYLEGGYLKNTFAGIDNRFTFDGGISWTFVKTSQHLLKADGGIGWTRELRVTEPSLSFMMGKLGGSYKFTLSKTAEFTDDAAFILDFSDAGDWRFQNVAAVSASMTTIFSLKASHTLNYIRKPAVGFGRTDTITAAAIVAKF
jgi:putative salt-induced outer membrane protein YdiY